MRTVVNEVAVCVRIEDNKRAEAWIEMPHHAEVLGVAPIHNNGLRVVVKYTQNGGEDPALKRVPIELVHGWGDLKDPGARYLGSHRFAENDEPNWHVFLSTQKD
jgi:hypothetical protein